MVISADEAVVVVRWATLEAAGLRGRSGHGLYAVVPVERWAAHRCQGASGPGGLVRSSGEEAAWLLVVEELVAVAVPLLPQLRWSGVGPLAALLLVEVA